MQPRALLLLLSLHLFALVICRPVEWDRYLQQRMSAAGSLRRPLHPHKVSSDLLFNGNLSVQLRRLIKHDSLVMLQVMLQTKKDSTNVVSIFDLRKRRFLCVDIDGELFNSRIVNREDCLFQYQEEPLDDFLSRSSGLEPDLQASSEKTRDVLLSGDPQKSLTGSSLLLASVLLPQIHRTRRSGQVSDPSDPLENHRPPRRNGEPKPDLRQGQSDKELPGAVSKETITSCDDPLQVLHSNGPVSPIKTNIEDRTEKD